MCTPERHDWLEDTDRGERRTQARRSKAFPPSPSALSRSLRSQVHYTHLACQVPPVTERPSSLTLSFPLSPTLLPPPPLLQALNPLPAPAHPPFLSFASSIPQSPSLGPRPGSRLLPNAQSMRVGPCDSKLSPEKHHSTA